MKDKFTKGPWEILPVEADKEYLRIRGTVPGGRYKIANVIDLEIYRGESEWCKLEREESAANGHLIACAPDMYKHIEEDIQILQRQAKQYVFGSYELRAVNLRIETKQKLLKRARGE